MTSELLKFLKESRNSVSRENIFNHLLCYDLKIAAAHRNYDLEIYRADVDRYGYDFILNDRDTFRALQVKTVVGRAKSWYIQKHLLRPTPVNCKRLGFEPSPEGEGQEGGIVVIDVVLNRNSVQRWRYFYTDVYILNALRSNLITKRIEKRKLDNFLSMLGEGARTDKISIPKSYFVEAQSAEHLLGLMGLHGRYNHSWREVLAEYLDLKNDSPRKEALREEIRKNISALIIPSR